MKLLVFGQPTGYVKNREMQKLVSKLERTGLTVEQIDMSSREGVARMEVYDVVATPAFIVARDDGTAVAVWQHTQPSYEELSHACGGFV